MGHRLVTFPHTATKVLLCLSLDGVPEEDYVYSIPDFTNLYVGALNIIFNIIEQGKKDQYVQRDIERGDTYELSLTL